MKIPQEYLEQEARERERVEAMLRDGTFEIEQGDEEFAGRYTTDDSEIPEAPPNPIYYTYMTNERGERILRMMTDCALDEIMVYASYIYEICGRKGLKFSII